MWFDTPRSKTGGAAVALLGLALLGLTPTASAEHGDEEAACPTQLEATVYRGGIVLLNFSHAPEADASNIYRTIEGDERQQIASIPSNETAFYADEETELGKDHTYEVRAQYGEHESQECAAVTVHVPENPPPRPPQEGNCPPAGDLRAEARDDGSIFIEARGLDRDARLMRAEAGNDFEQVAQLGPVDNTYHDTDTDEGTSYTYRLVAGGAICDIVEVTAVPFFGAAGAALAVLVGVGAYVARRR